MYLVTDSCSVDFGRREDVGEERHPSGDSGSGDAAAADGEPPGHQDAVRPRSRKRMRIATFLLSPLLSSPVLLVSISSLSLFSPTCFPQFSDRE